MSTRLHFEYTSKEFVPLATPYEVISKPTEQGKFDVAIREKRTSIWTKVDGVSADSAEDAEKIGWEQFEENLKRKQKGDK